MFLAAQACGQAVDGSVVSHWAIAPFLGTGAYRVSRDQSIFAIAYTPRWAIAESSDAWEENRTRGIEFVLPMAVGLNSFDLADIPDIVDFDNFATLSVVPGVYLTFPLSPRWTLLGTANIGLGTRLDGGDVALTYRAGVRSRYRFGNPDGFRWSLLNALEFIGYSADNGTSSEFMPFSLGVEFENGLGELRIGGDEVELVTHIVATGLAFAVPDNS